VQRAGLLLLCLLLLLLILDGCLHLHGGLIRMLIAGQDLVPERRKVVWLAAATETACAM
jgi:hypothetical protein